MSVQIFLDNYQNVCYPGQTISGRVECQFNKEKNLRAVRIKFKGHAETEWTEQESYYDSSSKQSKTRSVRYHGEEVYMDAEYNLAQGGENFQLSAGRHVYPFSYILPAQLPSSFEGTYGGVRYYLKATIDRPWKFDYEAKVPINVASLLDLNFIPGLRDPIAVSDEKTMCSCWCNDAGALTFNVTLPVGGYIPGQEVNVGAYIQNMTNVSVESVKFKIVANYEYITQYPSTHHRYGEERLVDIVEGGVGAHGEKSWTTTLPVPTNFEYPNLIPCGIINVNYVLVAKAVLPFPHSNMDMEIPLKIGNVALTGVNTTLPGPPLSNINIDFPAEGDNSYPPKYPGGPPPAGIVPYAPGEDASAPYPGNPAGPYPGGSAAPFPGAAAPYPGSSAPAPYPGSSAPAPYPGGAAAPYPPGPPIVAPYPPGPIAGAPYAPVANGNSEKAPYAPPQQLGWSMPGNPSASAPPPPSYEDSQKLPEKEKL